MDSHAVRMRIDRRDATQNRVRCSGGQDGFQNSDPLKLFTCFARACPDANNLAVEGWWTSLKMRRFYILRKS